MGLAQRYLWFGSLTLTAVTPLVISPNGDDPFRAPKLFVFQAGALVLTALLVIGAQSETALLARLRNHRAVVILAASALLWTTVTTLLSQNPVVSHMAPFTFGCYVLYFVTILAVAPRKISHTAIAIAIPTAITVTYAIAQLLRLRTPFIQYDSGGTRRQVIALLGNPNYVGTFLVLPLMAFLAMLLVCRRSRWVFVVLTALTSVAVAATLTLTALIAITCGVISLLVTSPSRRARRLLLAALLIALTAGAFYSPAQERLFDAINLVQTGRYDLLSSHRLPAFVTAVLMFSDHPVTGVGPGMFAAEYMSYRLRVDELHPKWIQTSNPNFGEVHNDHLQLLAESGLPGYAIFLVFITKVALLSFGSHRDLSVEAEFVRVFSFPAAVSFVVLAMGQFPLQLAASSVTAVFFSALCLAWNDDNLSL